MAYFENKGTELMPRDCRKSFYSKARIVRSGSVIVLVSYGTPVLVVEDGVVRRTWGGYSATTARHINAFCAEYGLPMVGYKKAWDALPVESFILTV